MPAYFCPRMIPATSELYENFANADGTTPVVCSEELSDIKVWVNVPDATDSCGLSPLTSSRPYAEVKVSARPKSCPFCDAEDARWFAVQEQNAKEDAMAEAGF